jgi:hypothetical protein
MPNYNIRRSNTCLYEFSSLSFSYYPSFIIHFFIFYYFFVLILFLPPSCALLVHHNIKLTTFSFIQNLQFIVFRSNVACSLAFHYIIWFLPYHFLKGCYKNTPFHICVCLIIESIGIVITNFWPSSLSWINMTLNFKIF